MKTKRKRITRKSRQWNEKLMLLSKKVNDKKRELTKHERIMFDIKFENKYLNA